MNSLRSYYELEEATEQEDRYFHIGQTTGSIAAVRALLICFRLNCEVPKNYRNGQLGKARTCSSLREAISLVKVALLIP